MDSEENSSENRVPLAEKLRPEKLADVVGQEKLVGENGILRKIVARGEPVSLIFWGPPGTGKTTLARIIAREMNADFIEISAVSAKKSDVVTLIERAKVNWNLRVRTILFVDEIHRFNKAQQDAFLPHVESGLITLIGATTENPSFEVISPLISRSRVVVLEKLTRENLREILHRGEKFLKLTKKITPEAEEILLENSNGDARKLLGNLEVASGLIQNREKITPEIIIAAVGKNLPRYDKNGDRHFDEISAFIKSLRAGDEVAALFYLARMIAAGEDAKFIARRMVIFASEDVGLAGNGALGLTLNAFLAIERVGLPEGGIILSHVAVALARAKKSRESYDLWREAENLAAKFPDSETPLEIRNAPTKLMRDLGYNSGYHWTAGFRHEKNYLPDEVFEFLKKNSDKNFAKLKNSLIKNTLSNVKNQESKND